LLGSTYAKVMKHLSYTAHFYGDRPSIAEETDHVTRRVRKTHDLPFSIIVPTFNEERIIADTLGAIRHHLSDVDYELIVTDDGSTDRTCEIAERYADRVVRLTGKKGTIGANRNRGARVAHGDYLVFVDADISIPRVNDCFAAIAEDFRGNPRLVGMTVKITFAPGEERVIDAIIHGILSRVFWFMNSVLRTGAASGEFQAIRRDAFAKLHGYSESLPAGEDNDLFLRLSRLGRTQIDLRVTAYTDNRRVQQLGWPRLLRLWAVNYCSVAFLHRSHAREWPPK
jgi:cellulose synthase/poly-beta-1,6-N-acetylglucosamine synthase-like glycosyltransferase